MLHGWLQEEFRFGSAESGERCKGCRRALAVMERCITLRARHADAGRELWGPVLECWCMTCAEVMDVAVGPRGGRMRQDGQWERDYAGLTRKFWDGVVDSQRRTQGQRKRVW